MHLRVILPIIGSDLIESVTQEVSALAAPGTTIDVRGIAEGTASIESQYDEALAGPGILRAVREAGTDGVDGLFITCFADPGVHAAREIANVPVVGGFEPALYTAMSLGDRIGVITVLPNSLPMLRALARRLQIDGRIGAIRTVDMPVLELHNRSRMISRLTEEALAAVHSGEAEVIVLGCTGMLGVADTIRAHLAEHGYAVPVIDPTAAAIAWLESNVKMGLRPSRITYRTPTAKARSLDHQG